MSYGTFVRWFRGEDRKGGFSLIDALNEAEETYGSDDHDSLEPIVPPSKPRQSRPAHEPFRPNHSSLPASIWATFQAPGSLQRDQQNAHVFRSFLPEGYSANPDAPASYPESSTSQDQEESSLLLPGGDIHRDIYKIIARAGAPRRANTFSGFPLGYTEESSLRAGDLLQPGGFRRQYLQMLSQQRLLRHQLSRAKLPVTSNLVDFLELYGGGDLTDTDSTGSSDSVDEGPPERIYATPWLRFIRQLLRDVLGNIVVVKKILLVNLKILCSQIALSIATTLRSMTSWTMNSRSLDTSTGVFMPMPW